MNEDLELIRSLWNGERSFKGSFYNYKDISFHPLREELRQQSFLIAGNSKYAIERAIKFGTGWHPAGGISGQKARELLEPYKDKLSNNFEIWVRIGITDQDIQEVIAEYTEYGINGVIVDLSRITDPEDHDNKFNELIELVSKL